MTRGEYVGWTITLVLIAVAAVLGAIAAIGAVA